MYDITVIVPPGQGIGFTLSGVQVREAATPADAHEILEAEMNDSRNGIIMIDETLKQDIPRHLQKRIDKSSIPLVVGIPVISKWEYVHTSDEVFANIIHRAIGYRVKF